MGGEGEEEGDARRLSAAVLEVTGVGRRKEKDKKKEKKKKKKNQKKKKKKTQKKN